MDLSNHPPNGVESTCERSVMPGGLGMKQTAVVIHHRLKDASNKDCSMGNVTTGAYFQHHSTEKQSLSSHSYTHINTNMQ